MINPEPLARDAARLIALAEALAEVAGECDQSVLAVSARDTARAARRFEAAMMPVDRAAIGHYRHEFTRLLWRAHRPEDTPLG